MTFEEAGVETYIVITETFLPLVRAQAKARGANPKLLIVKHPVGGLNEEELRERIQTAFGELKTVLAAKQFGRRSIDRRPSLIQELL